jgi:ubiquinone biosynthesis protein COQ9
LGVKKNQFYIDNPDKNEAFIEFEKIIKKVITLGKALNKYANEVLKFVDVSFS